MAELIFLLLVLGVVGGLVIAYNGYPWIGLPLTALSCWAILFVWYAWP